MARLLQRNDDELVVVAHDRALRIAKHLIRILRDELGQGEAKLHMAQKAVAAGLRCEHPYAMIKAEYPRKWDGNRAINHLLAHGFVDDEAVAFQAIGLLEHRTSYDADANNWPIIAFAD